MEAPQGQDDRCVGAHGWGEVVHLVMASSDVTFVAWEQPWGTYTTETDGCSKGVLFLLQKGGCQTSATTGRVSPQLLAQSRHSAVQGMNG